MFMDYAALLDLTALISLDFSKAFDTTSFKLAQLDSWPHI